MMSAVSIMIRPRPPELDKPDRAAAVGTIPPPHSEILDPDAVVLEGDTDNLMTMCSCSASSDAPY
jgi:hypothetical protein